MSRRIVTRFLVVVTGLTVVAAAASHGYARWVKYSAKKELQAAGITYSEASFIDQACSKGNRVALLLFLKSGMSVNTRGTNDTTALHCAVRQRQESFAALLIERGADVNAKDSNGVTPLMEAARWGAQETVSLLLKAHADIKSTDNAGNTALTLAGNVCSSITCTTHVMELLLNNGADPKARNRAGQNALSALFRREQRGDTPEVASLIDRLAQGGADPNALNNYGERLLNTVAASGNRTAVERLIAAGADVNAKGGRTGTPLIAAAKFPEIVGLLLKGNADPNIGTDSGETPLLVAGRERALASMQLLLEAGANQNPPPPSREGALHLAAKMADQDEVALLLRYPASLDARDAEGQTPLHALARYGSDDSVSRADIARTLIQAGANREARDRQGRTPAELAVIAHAQNLASVLSGGRIKPTVAQATRPVVDPAAGCVRLPSGACLAIRPFSARFRSRSSQP